MQRLAVSFKEAPNLASPTQEKKIIIKRQFFCCFSFERRENPRVSAQNHQKKGGQDLLKTKRGCVCDSTLFFIFPPTPCCAADDDDDDDDLYNQIQRAARLLDTYAVLAQQQQHFLLDEKVVARCCVYKDAC
jgi:hypothetical protein